MSRRSVLARLLALTAFFALATGSSTALADVASPELAAPVPDKPATEETPPAQVKPDEAKKDEAKPDEAKKADAKDDKKADDKKAGSCSMVDNDDRVIGLAGLVLLISGFALRRRRD